jgi:hypothetical protein
MTHIEKRRAGAGADAAIQRWEDEGGRALAPEEPLRAGPDELPGSDPEEGSSFGGLPYKGRLR